MAIFCLLTATGTIAACSTDDISSPQVSAATISIVSGDSQIGPPGQPLAEAIVAQVTDTSGRPVSGLVLAFDVLEGGGTVDLPSALTDDSGYARVFWTLGDGLIQTMVVATADERVVASPAAVTATNDRWVHLSVISGAGQTGARGEQLQDPFVLKVTDSYGDPVAGVALHFQITAGGGLLDQTAATTDQEGHVSLLPTLGTGAYQRIKASVVHEYWFARYLFLQAETQFAANAVDGDWISDIEFTDNTGVTIQHDGRIFESAHFLTFSDASSDEVRKQYAGMAEESLGELLEAFEIASAEELGILGDSPETKIKIYCSMALDVNNYAFPYGFVLMDINHSAWELPWAPMRRANYRNIVKHEVMHVLQYLLGADGQEYWSDAWFAEGIAEHVSGGSFYHVESWDQVGAWQLSETHVNPLTIRLLRRDVPSGGDPAEYYPMFGLAMEYLLDPKGAGGSLLDVKSLMREDALGTGFQSAFETHMGIQFAYFRDNFYQLMAEFLSIY